MFKPLMACVKVNATGNLPDLKEIGCKSVWLVYISPLFRPIEQLLAFKIVKIYPHPVAFSLRFFKSDRLLENIFMNDTLAS